MLTGSCVCGAVAFEVSAPFEGAGWCHCTRCRKRTGSAASAAGAAAPGSFAVTRGQESVREWAPPDGWVKAFCTDCGGHLYSRAPEGFERVAVRLGAIDGDPGIRPQYHQFTASAAVWDPIPDDGLPRHPGRRPPGA